MLEDRGRYVLDRAKTWYIVFGHPSPLIMGKRIPTNGLITHHLHEKTTRISTDTLITLKTEGNKNPKKSTRAQRSKRQRSRTAVKQRRAS